MGKFRVYLKQFDDDGNYVDDWTDITEDCDATSIGALKKSLDNTEYDVGIFKSSGISLTVINSNGKYSDVGVPGSVFRYRRSNSLIRLTWHINDTDLCCGFFRAGYIRMGTEVDVFEGLLNDDALKQNASEQHLAFKVMGKESVFNEVKVPFSSISAGDTFQSIIYNLLNQSSITGVGLTVSLANINPGTDSVTDAIAVLENKTITEAMKEILLPSNSVLYVEDNVVYVSKRTPSAATVFTFYGQGSNTGIENIIDIQDFRSGINRLFNFWTWESTTLVSQNVSSVALYGVKKKEIKSDLITNTTKRQTILDSLKTEFAEPKRELILRCPIDYDTLDIRLLDKVQIDYPNIAISSNGVDIPLYDMAIYDLARYPFELLPITIESTARFKVLSRDIDPTNHELILYLRETDSE